MRPIIHRHVSHSNYPKCVCFVVHLKFLTLVLFLSYDNKKYIFLVPQSVTPTETTDTNETILAMVDQQPETTVDYHIDIWHHISKHIEPEDVGRFSLICRKTAYVTSTSEFWKHMYHRHATDVTMDALPDRLRPQHIFAERRGLRANVIRSLFIVHRPFVDRLARLRQLETLSSDFEATSDNLHTHPIVRKIHQRKYHGKFINKSIEMPRKSSFWSKAYNFLPKCYSNHLEECDKHMSRRARQRRTQQFGHLHQSEEIYHNDHNGCIIVLVKALKQVRIKRLGVAGATNVRTIDAKPLKSLVKSMSVSANSFKKPVPTVDVRLFYQEPQHRSAFKFTQTTQIGLYEWWDPMYDRVCADEF